MTCETTTNNCTECPCLGTTEWGVLSECELDSVNKSKRMITCEPGETLYSQGEPSNGIYCIRSGLIGLRRVETNGNSVLIRLVTEGSTVGYRTFLTRGARANSAEALTASVMCYIPRPKVEEILKENSVLGESFLQHFIDDATETENNYVRSLTMGMKSRFLHLILVFYERYGYQDENGNAVVELPVKRGELAELVGVRPESISRLIDQLQANEIMLFKDRRIQFSNVDEILKQAGAIV